MCKGVDTMRFETPFPDAVFKGEITGYTHEVDGVPPSTVIKTTDTWHIHVDWQTTGNATGMITGEWHIQAFLESMGPGPEKTIIEPPLVIPLTPGVSPILYSREVPIQPKIVPAGTYKLVVVMTYIEPTGHPGPMAGFIEGPLLQFYEP